MRQSAALVLIAVAVTGMASAGQGPVPPDLDARVESYVRPLVETNNFSGCILIAEGDNVRLRHCWGEANRELGVPNTPATRFHVASVAKSFTAAAVLLLEEEGRLKVSDPLARFIPDYPRGQEITIHHLLTHTSGIPNVNEFPDYERNSRFAWTLPEIVSWFKDKPLDLAPGARYSYSNSNYNLLALVIEKVSGLGYGEFLRKRLLEPAGLRDTGHDGQATALIAHRAMGYMPAGLRGVENAPFLDWSIKTGNGSLYSTADDLHRWDRALESGRVLGEKALQKAFTNHAEGAGYGWFIRDKAPRRSIAINGRAPGFSANLERFVDTDVVVVTLANLYSSITQTMAADLGAIAHGESRAALLPPSPVAVSGEVMDRYVGRWQFGPDFSFNPNMVGEVKRTDEGLVIASGGGGGTSFLIPLAPDRFLDRLYGGTVRFVAEPSGEVNTLVWNFGRDYAAKRLPR